MQVTTDAEQPDDGGQGNEVDESGAFFVVGRAGFAGTVDQSESVALVDAQKTESQHGHQHQKNRLLEDQYQTDQAEGDEGTGDFPEGRAGALRDDVGIHADAPFPFTDGVAFLLFGW